jgi:hypothetical protein
LPGKTSVQTEPRRGGTDRETTMNTATLVSKGRVVGLVTLLMGVGYAVLGGGLLLAGTDLSARLEGDPAGGMGPLLQIIGGFMAVIGAAFLVQGVAGLFAGGGVLSSRPWGRGLALVFAVLAVLWGLAFLGLSRGDATLIALGAVQLLYGVFALASLLKGGGAGA